MGVKLAAASGGSVELVPTNTASNFTATLPAATTTVVGTDTTQTLTNKTLSGAVWTAPAGSTITSGTAVASTSGTSITFTGIPSWAKRVTVILQSVSTTGASPYLIRLGTSSGVETTGYVTSTQLVSSTSNTTRATSYTNGFGLSWSTGAAGEVNTVTMQFVYLGSNGWNGMGMQNYAAAGGGHFITGQKTLSGTLDRISVTTVGGTDTFDAGTINILYE